MEKAKCINENCGNTLDKYDKKSNVPWPWPGYGTIGCLFVKATVFTRNSLIN